VAALCRNQDQKILLCRRKPSLSHGGLWELPGGKIELGESPRVALTRELWEELGIQSTITSHFSNSTWSSEDITIELICFLVQLHKEILQSTDHDQLNWYSITELAEMIAGDFPITKPDLPILKKLTSIFFIDPS
jgi:mutator protein MutT